MPVKTGCFATDFITAEIAPLSGSSTEISAASNPLKAAAVD